MNKLNWHQVEFETTMAEQPVNLSTVLYLGVFSRAEQRFLQAIFKAIANGGGRCVATLAMLAREIQHQQVNHAQCDRPSSRNWPSEKDRAPLLGCLASQHFDLWGSDNSSAHEGKQRRTNVWRNPTSLACGRKL